MSRENKNPSLADLGMGMSRRSQKAALKYLQDDKRRTDNMRAADELSGVGYPIDQQLRALVRDANQEVSHGRYPLVHLWDVVSGFVRYEESAVGTFFRLLPERDHAFDANDFFAYASDEAVKAATIDKLLNLPEGVIHSFTHIGNEDDVVFEHDNGDPVVLIGLSLVRRGMRLYWQTSGGYVAHLEETTAARRAELAGNSAQIKAYKSQLSPDKVHELMNPTAKPVAGTSGVWDCAAFGVFNLVHQTHETRASSRNWTVSQAVFSDNHSQWADRYDHDDDIRRLVDKAVAQVERDHLLFEVAETAFSLPAYFAAKVQFVRKDERKTELGLGRSQKAKHAMKAPPDMRMVTRQVSTLDFGLGKAAAKTYTPPRFRVEVDGYYRRLEPNALGRDREGNPLRGQTWVVGHARWKDKPVKLGVVRVKTTISSAMDKATRLGLEGTQSVVVKT